jgi:hypothetical protein
MRYYFDTEFNRMSGALVVKNDVDHSIYLY